MDSEAVLRFYTEMLEDRQKVTMDSEAGLRLDTEM
jgi:hypothetical protein